jgi:hypothetical protein
MAVLTSHDESPSGGSGGYSSTRGRRDLAAAAAGVTPRHGKNWRGLFYTPSVLFSLFWSFLKNKKSERFQYVKESRLVPIMLCATYEVGLCLPHHVAELCVDRVMLCHVS